MNIVILDFESRSAVGLAEVGPWKYAAHESTDLTCAGFKFIGHPGKAWLPPWVKEILGDHPVPVDLVSTERLQAGFNRVDMWIAHNMEFERAMWFHQMHRKYGFPDLPLEKCDCTMARASVHALPRKLESVCEALNLLARKDMAGHKLMMQMCKPRKPRKAEREDLLKSGEINEIDDKTFYHPESDCVLRFWHETPEQLVRNIEYCIADLEAEEELHQTVLPMTTAEREIWLHDQVVNGRGIHIDVSAVQHIVNTLERHNNNMLAEFRQLIGHKTVTTKQHAVVKEWLSLNGIHPPNMQKATLAKLLESPDLPAHVHRALTIRQALAKASTNKFTAMLNLAQEDQRARSTILHHGASTGRPAGKAIQPLNMPRDCYKGEELEAVFQAFETGDIDYISRTYDDPYYAASRCLRGALCAAPGNMYFCADYQSIEARGNSWAAGDEEKLEVFRQGVDVYVDTAAGTFGISYEEVNDEQRQIGKVQELALGYEGGIGAYVAMAGSYNIDLEALPAIVMPFAAQDELTGDFGAWAMAKRYIENQERNEAENIPSFDAAVACDVLKQKWRVKNYRIKASWKGYFQAALKAIQKPGQIFGFRKFQYRTWKDSAGNNYLVCQLPSGRLLYYFDPRIKIYIDDEDREKPIITHMTVDSNTKRWVRRAVYGGLFCENNVQALCRDIHTEAMLRVERHGYPVVLHVYDEIVAETRASFGNLAEFERLLCVVPDWAKGFPIAAAGWRGVRYRKG